MSQSVTFKKVSLKALALSLVREGKLDDGVEKYKEYLSLNDQDDDAWAGLGGAHRRKGEIDEAIGNYEKAFNINPNSTYAVVNVVMLLKARNDEADKSRLNDYLTKAIKLTRSKIKDAEENNPTEIDYWTWYDLGMLQLIHGNTAVAFDSYNYAAESTPQNAAETFRSVILALEFLHKHNPTIEGMNKVLEDLQRRFKRAAGDSRSLQES